MTKLIDALAAAAHLDNIEQLLKTCAAVVSRDEREFDEGSRKFASLEIAEIVRRALDGDPCAHRFVCYRVAEALCEGETMSELLAAYTAKVMFKEAEATTGSWGRGRTTKRTRNSIVVLLLQLLEACGIHPTRNCATEQECGSSIVAEWLNDVGDPIGETGVAKIWERHK